MSNTFSYDNNNNNGNVQRVRDAHDSFTLPLCGPLE